MSEFVLNPATKMDALTLWVGDLENMSSYYENALALEPIEEITRPAQIREALGVRAGATSTSGASIHGDSANNAYAYRVLGRRGTPLIKLVAAPDLPVGDHRQAGLFHTAFLFETKAALAATVYRAVKDQRSRFAGSSDHLVSEAFYFTDPEGNGIELYVDRPKEEWRRDSSGNLKMDTLYLDPNRFLQDHLDETVLATASEQGGSIGHMHLQVGDIGLARSFYVDALGFEASTQTIPGAIFAAAGGYHHHLGLNTWNSQGVGPRAASLGLADVAITVPAREDLDALAARLKRAGMKLNDSGAVIQTFDPWGTQVTVSLSANTSQ